MEEVHSTANLEREILEDARKKAAKVLQTAEAQIAEAEAGREKRLAEALSAERERITKKIAAERTESQAALTLEKRRIYLRRITDLLNAALDAFFDSLDRAEILGLLEKELRERAGALDGAGEGSLVTYRALTRAEAETLLAKALPAGAASAFTFREAGARFTVPGRLPALVIDTPEARITAALDAAANDLKLAKREELLSALLSAHGALP